MNIFPLYMQDAFSYPAAMAYGVGLGFAFGFVLERAGFGRAKNLVAQFYLNDMRVFKVMFTAIVTTTVGIGVLSGLGLLNMGALSIPATWFIPQIVGGLTLGAGFVMSGYCPGTAFIAMGSGYRDGLYSIVGSLLGGVAFVFVYPFIETFYLNGGGQGVLTLPEVFGLSWQVVSFGVALLAVGAFIGAEQAEGWIARRTGEPLPEGDALDRNGTFGALMLMAAVGIGTLALPSTPPAQEVKQATYIGPMGLANRLVAQQESYYVVDLRAPADCAAKRVPGAMCLTKDDAEAHFIHDLPPTRTLVLYDQGDVAELPESAKHFEGDVMVLTGGFTAFKAKVLTAPTPPKNPTPESAEAYQLASALHAHYAGVKMSAAPLAKPKAVKRVVKKGGGC